MTPVQLFGVVVRSLGLVMTIYGIGACFFGVIALLSPGPGAAIVIVPAAFALLAIGLWLLRGAESLVAFAYPETKGPAAPSELR